MKANSCY